MVALISCSLLDGCCHSLETVGWLLSFPRDFWMVAVSNQSFLDTCGYFLDASDTRQSFHHPRTMARAPSMSGTAQTVTPKRGC